MEAPKPRKSPKEVLALAREVIRSVVDLEGVYDPEALYEMQGKKLLHYLAFCIEIGQGAEYQFQNGRCILRRKAVARG